MPGAGGHQLAALGTFRPRPGPGQGTAMLRPRSCWPHSVTLDKDMTFLLCSLGTKTGHKVGRGTKPKLNSAERQTAAPCRETRDIIDLWEVASASSVWALNFCLTAHELRERKSKGVTLGPQGLRVLRVLEWHKWFPFPCSPRGNAGNFS